MTNRVEFRITVCPSVRASNCLQVQVKYLETNAPWRTEPGYCHAHKMQID